MVLGTNKLSATDKFTNPEETAEIFNKFFHSVLTGEHGTADTLLSNTEQLSEIEVFEAMTSLKPNKAPGPDNIHSQVLKN